MLWAGVLRQRKDVFPKAEGLPVVSQSLPPRERLRRVAGRFWKWRSLLKESNMLIHGQQEPWEGTKYSRDQLTRSQTESVPAPDRNVSKTKGTSITETFHANKCQSAMVAFMATTHPHVSTASTSQAPFVQYDVCYVCCIISISISLHGISS